MISEQGEGDAAQRCGSREFSDRREISLLLSRV